jgi:hypothetical protein
VWKINYPVAQLVSRHRGTLPVILTRLYGGQRPSKRSAQAHGPGAPV